MRWLVVGVLVVVCFMAHARAPTPAGKRMQGLVAGAVLIAVALVRAVHYLHLPPQPLLTLTHHFRSPVNSFLMIEVPLILGYGFFAGSLLALLFAPTRK